MSASCSSKPSPDYRVGLRINAVCAFQAVRQAAQSAREWLAGQNLSADELSAWELVLAEAGNNAVEHAAEPGRRQAVELEISCGETDVEARVTDHTPGFDLPETVELPDAENEGGRGLFLIRSLTDQAAYFRHPKGNTLVLRKHRAAPARPEDPDPLALQRRLTESERAAAELTEELASSYESLVALFRYSAELGVEMDLQQFTLRLLADLVQLAEADAAVLRLLDPQGRLVLQATLPETLANQLPACLSNEKSPGRELATLQTREDSWFDSEQPLEPADALGAVPGAKSGVCHAFGTAETMLGTLTLVRCDSPRSFHSAQTSLLHTFTDFLAIQMVNSRLQEERSRAQITRRELEIAASIQRSLLPPSLPSCPPFELAAYYRSARQVGGDFYDVIPVGEAGVLLLIADVMGKGVPAALFATVLRTAIRSMPALQDQPARLLTAVNRTLCEDLSRVDMFITVKVVFLDRRRACLISASAGHCPLLVALPGQLAALPVDDSGLPLGIEAACQYTECVTAFSRGSASLLYTDGLTESRSPEGRFFGEQRLAAALAKGARQAEDVEALRALLLADFESHLGGAPPADDQTFLLLRHEP